MRKRLIMLVMVCMVGGLLTGCGKKKEEANDTKDTEAQEVLDQPSMEKVNYEKALKLGKYKGLKVTMTVTPVTDESLETEIKNMLAQYPTVVGDGEVAGEGDVVNIDYEGKLDGVAFEGGTAQGSDLTLGSGTFIPGFEEGLIGVTKGQTLDLNITFPEDYQSEDLAGKAVVFTVTVNEIKRAVEAPTDEWVATNTSYKTVDEYRAGLKKQMEESNKTSAEQTAEQDAFMQVLESSEVKDYPKELLDYGVKRYKKSVEDQAKAYGMELKDILEGQNMTEKQFEEEAKTTGESFAKQILVFNAIADKEGFKKSDKAYKETLDALVEQAGVASEKELAKTYGENSIHTDVLIKMVMDLIIKEADVKEVETTPTPEATPAEETPAEETPAE